MSEPSGKKERVYDSTVFPLMEQIIAACKSAGIGFVASFELDADPDDPSDPLRCTTIIPPGGGGEWQSPAMRKAEAALRPERPHAVAVMETMRPDGTKVITVRGIS